MAETFGSALRQRRLHRQWSQLVLAQEAGSSARHLSCLETGKALPGRELVLQLAAVLDVPLREANVWLLLAGHAPHYREQPLHHPRMAAARATVDLVLRRYEPWPAIAIDRHWNIVASNRMVALLLSTLPSPSSWTMPINAVRLSLSPQGLAPAIVNQRAWFRAIRQRLRQQAIASRDPALHALCKMVDDATAERHLDDDDVTPTTDGDDLLMPLVLRTGWGELRLLTTVTVFGSPVEVTLQELALETFLPADEATAAALRTAYDALAVDASPTSP